MITDAIIYIIYLFILAISSPLRLLSDVSFSTDFNNSITSASNSIATLNTYFPVSTLIAVLDVFIGIEIAIGIYKIMMWIVRRFPTQS